MQALKLSNFTLTSALGRGVEAQWQALQAEQSGLRACDFDDCDLPAWIGRVDAVEQQPINGSLAAHDGRNNRLAAIGLEQDGFAASVAAAAQRYGSERIGVFIGTSTSGIYQTELAYRNRDPETGRLPENFIYQHSQNCYSVGDYVRSHLQLRGPALVISTACSSSAKVFASASRYIDSGLIDAAVVGGVDSLCLTTLYGFSSLQLVSPDPCRPADVQRNGISIGEAAGFALLEKAAPGDSEIAVLGYGESSDAYHMSSPDPDGRGAAMAMSSALQRAGLSAADVDYINLHGTATPANDLSEGRAVAQIFGEHTACSSTKGWTGHALGAAGIAEVVFCALAIEHGFMPRSLNTVDLDPEIPNQILLESQARTVRAALTNSFGFGGSNCSLVLGRPA
ncbi:MAG: beta-ketoacyl-[acyl-carrier-protein] synthase family protein [Nevskiales bacterium]